MIEINNIEVEDWDIHSDKFFARYFLEDHPRFMSVPLMYLELFVTKKNLLGWSNMVFKNNEYVDDAEGIWQFGDWVKERLDAEIVRDFIVSQLNENG